MDEQIDRENQKVGTGFRPSLSFYHQNSEGTGCALKLELVPAVSGSGGYVFATFAQQLTVASKGGSGKGAKATFDWKNAIIVKLDIGDLTEMIMVFRGVRESIEDGKGLYHESDRAVTIIRLEHLIEPVPAYRFGASRKLKSGDGVKRISILLSVAESLSLSLSLESMLGIIAFGIPKDPPRQIQPERSINYTKGTRPAGDIDVRMRL